MAAPHVVLTSVPVSPTSSPPANAGAPPEAGRETFAARLDMELDALLAAESGAPRERDEAAPAAHEESAAAADTAAALPWPLHAWPAALQPPAPSDGDHAVSTELPNAFAPGVAPAAPGAARAVEALATLSDQHDALLPAVPGETPAAAQAVTSPPGPPAALPAAGRTAQIEPPVHAPEWREAFGDRVVLLARERIQAAELHVSPPELGPVSVRIDVHGSEANIVFGVQHPDTRTAIAEALPRLADLLAAQGLALGGAQVGAQLARDREGAAPGPARGTRDDPADARVTPVTTARRGLVDLFA